METPNIIISLSEWLGCIIQCDLDTLDQELQKIEQEQGDNLFDPTTWEPRDCDPVDLLNLIILDNTFHELVNVDEEFSETSARRYFDKFGVNFIDVDPLVKLSVSGYLNQQYCYDFERQHDHRPIHSLKSIYDYAQAITRSFHTSFALPDYLLEVLDEQADGNINPLTDGDINGYMFDLSVILNKHLPNLLNVYSTDRDVDLVSSLIGAIADDLEDFASNVTANYHEGMSEVDHNTCAYMLVSNRIYDFCTQINPE